MKQKWLLLVVVLIITQGLCASDSPVYLEEARTIRKILGLDKYPFDPAISEMNIAIWDNGFGKKSELAEYLPDAELIEFAGEGGSQLDEQETHGRTMGVIIDRLLKEATRSKNGSLSNAKFKLKLINANGTTNLHLARKWCKANNVKLFLYSQNWEYMGNFDGTGPVNEVFTTAAIEDGMIPVVADGNYGGRVFNGKIKRLDDGWLQLKENQKCLRIKSNIDRNPIRLVLAWNSFSQNENAGTDKVLKLFLYDEDGNLRSSSELNQVLNKEGKKKPDAGQSFLARQIIEFEPVKSTVEIEDATPLKSKSPKADEAFEAPAEAAVATPPVPGNIELPAPKPNVANAQPEVLPAPPADSKLPTTPKVDTSVAPAGATAEGVKVVVKTTTAKKRVLLSRNTKNGYYLACVRAESNNWTGKDRLRLTVLDKKNEIKVRRDGRMQTVRALEFVDATKGREIMVPADNPNVITVGNPSAYSSVGPTMANVEKADVIMPGSIIDFSDGEGSYGTSNDAAIFIPVVATMLAARPDLTVPMIKKWAQRQFNADSIATMTIDEVKKKLPPSMIEMLTDNLGGQQPTMAGQYTDKRYVIGIQNDPSDLTGLFPTIADDKSSFDYKYFVKVKSFEVTYYDQFGQPHGNIDFEGVRYLKADTGDKLATVPIDYVEIRKALDVRMWQTPTPEELKNLDV